MAETRDLKPGDRITVKVGGMPYETVIDSDGTQRFVANAVLRHLVDRGVIDLNALAIAFSEGAFPQRDHAEFNMMLGYSVDGFADLSAFEDLEIENPLWTAKS